MTTTIEHCATCGHQIKLNISGSWAHVRKPKGCECQCVGPFEIQEQAPFLQPESKPQPARRISQSEVACFKRCRRKWWLSYHRALRLRAETRVGPMPFGSRIHVALAAYYGQGMNPEDAFNIAVAEDRQRMTDRAVQFDEEDFEAEAELGRIMIRGYLDWLAETGADADLDVLAAEDRIMHEVKVGDVPVTLMGKLDVRARVRSTGRHVFLDHKTTGSAISTVVKTLSLDEQMLTYQLLERLAAPSGEHVESGLYNILRKVKRTPRATPPFYDRIEAYHGDKEIRAFWYRIHGEISEILRVSAQLEDGADPGVVAYPTPEGSCAWSCDFFAGCQMFDDGSAAEEFLDQYYEVGDPYERYEPTGAL